jgi:hypothetical protein
MKITFNESKFCVSFSLTPETPQEVAQIARMAQSSKREPAHISFSFSGENPTGSVYINKIAESKQSNFISNNKK